MKKREVEAPPEPTFETPAVEAFNEFVGSIPPDKRIQVTVSRLPSDLHPLLRAPEALYPAPSLGAFEEMKEEVARRFGSGDYVLHVLLYGDRSRIEKRHQLKFRIGAVPGHPGSGQIPDALDAPEEVPDPMDLLRNTIMRAAQLRAEASELETAARLAGMGGNTPGPAVPVLDPLKMLTEVLAAVKTLTPAPTPAADPAGMVGMVKDLFGVIRDLAPEGVAPQGFWTAAMPHIVDLLKSYAPYLPHIAAALAQAKQVVSGAAVREVPEAAPVGPVANEAAFVPLTGGNPMLSLALRTFLDLAYLECRKDHAPESAEQAYNRLADHADQNFPGILNYLAGLPASELFNEWIGLDPRLAGEPRAKAFCEGFHRFLTDSEPSPRPQEKKT